MELKINEKYFDLIRHGIKIYEMRLLDDKLNEFTKDMKRSKYLTFICDNKKLKCIVNIYTIIEAEKLFMSDYKFKKLVNTIFYNRPPTMAETKTTSAYKELCNFYPDFKLSDSFVIFEILKVEEIESER